MRPTFIFFFFLAFSFSNANAQKLLQIEKLHSPKTIKYFIGDEITFQLKGEDSWYTRNIENVSYEGNVMFVVDGQIKLSDVTALRTFKPSKWSRPLSNQLIFFAPVWAGYTAVASIFDDDVSFGKSDYIIMGSSIATAGILKFLFKHKTYRFQKKNKESKKWRLRILDLTVGG